MRPGKWMTSSPEAEDFGIWKKVSELSFGLRRGKFIFGTRRGKTSLGLRDARANELVEI